MKKKKKRVIRMLTFGHSWMPTTWKRRERSFSVASSFWVLEVMHHQRWLLMYGTQGARSRFVTFFDS